MALKMYMSSDPALLSFQEIIKDVSKSLAALLFAAACLAKVCLAKSCLANLGNCVQL